MGKGVRPRGVRGGVEGSRQSPFVAGSSPPRETPTGGNTMKIDDISLTIVTAQVLSEAGWDASHG